MVDSNSILCREIKNADFDYLLGVVETKSIELHTFWLVVYIYYCSCISSSSANFKHRRTTSDFADAFPDFVP